MQGARGDCAEAEEAGEAGEVMDATAKTPNFRNVDACWNCSHSRVDFAWEYSTTVCPFRPKTDNDVNDYSICDRWKRKKGGG